MGNGDDLIAGDDVFAAGKPSLLGYPSVQNAQPPVLAFTKLGFVRGLGRPFFSSYSSMLLCNVLNIRK